MIDALGSFRRDKLRARAHHVVERLVGNEGVNERAIECLRCTIERFKSDCAAGLVLFQGKNSWLRDTETGCHLGGGHAEGVADGA